MTPFLKYLGFDDNTVKNLPSDILQAAKLYDGMQRIYVDIPNDQPNKKAALAKVIAEGSRNLLIRINALVSNTPQIAAAISQAATQMPSIVRPQIQPPTTQPPESPQTTAPETPTTETPAPEPMNTYGLKVGDEIPSEVLNGWSEYPGLNYYWKKWKIGIGSFTGDRTITGFQVKDGAVAFSVTGTSDAVFLRAEGFREFMENYLQTQAQPQPPTTQPPESPKPAAAPESPKPAKKRGRPKKESQAPQAAQPTKPTEKPKRGRPKKQEDTRQSQIAQRLKNIEF